MITDEEAMKLMTKTEAIDFGMLWLDMNEDSKDTQTYQFFVIALQALGETPISYSEPVIKARWIKNEGMMPPEYAGTHHCSNCSHSLHLNMNGRIYDYCPKCGADMREDSTIVAEKK